MRFHASLEARRRYGLGDFPLEEAGSLRLPSSRHARILAARLRDVHESAGTAWREVRGGQIHALALINEIFHRVIALYRDERLPDLDRSLPAALALRLGSPELDAVLRRLAIDFPPAAVAAGTDPARFLSGAGGWPGRRPALLHELVVLWLANRNSACEPLLDLFDDEPLRRESAFSPLWEATRAFFDAAPPFGPPFVPEEQGLIALLRSPALAEPHSLSGQLRYIRERWGMLLERVGLMREVLSGLDLLREEEEGFRTPPGDSAVRSEVPDLSALAGEEESFSPDSDWMRRVVLMARNAHVWLAQLSRRHGLMIERLDQVPDEELERLARWGVTGLWLIGLWQRSGASRDIKQMRGNPDAAASAYSIGAYDIAEDLGGEPAWRALRDRAERVGIRLASDMVPNHMGIDSRWLIDHPDRFLSLPASPYPAYSFTGPDLSPDPAVGIFIEDHYADASDAAVVFRRVDRRTGEERFVYHGNDGTSTPWNDTAQMDYLNPETREAVIQTILAVARQFPIIRFDAAMTLAKRHYQRLWFPQPGTGGAIPSRAEHGLTREEFDRRMPEEFWREVVDRAAREAPDTLLLAEAFWLMEGYFVRTLGMHRVYNSAFMNMLRDEENAKYRLVIRNTIEFDPEILGRYVNFMSNPDERTAIEQFGDGDKYFGVATLMATLPGMPMFGHGQIEGMTERYGMEFRRPYRDEDPDPHLVGRHEAEIAPLLARRSLFAGSREFLLYDLVAESGTVDENVFAYSNRQGSEAALVVYHNRFAETSGWIRESAAYGTRGADGGRTQRRRTLGEGLGLPNASDDYIVFRDQVSGMEFLRPARELHEKGLQIVLHAYGRQVFLGFRPVHDGAGRPWRRLADQLQGRGVASVEGALHELVLSEIRNPFAALAGPGALRRLIEGRAIAADHGAGAARRGAGVPARRAGGAARRAGVTDEHAAGATEHEAGAAEHGAGATEHWAGAAEQSARLPEEFASRLAEFFFAVAQFTGGIPASPDDAAAKARSGILSVLALPALSREHPWPKSARYREATRSLSEAATSNAFLGGLLGREIFAALKTGSGTVSETETVPDPVSWGLAEILAAGIEDAGTDPEAARRAAEGAVILLPHGRWFDEPGAARPRAHAALNRLMDDPAIQRWIVVNESEGVTWFHRERFEELLRWLLAFAALDAIASPPPGGIPAALVERFEIVRLLREALEKSGHRLDGLRGALGPRRAPRRRALSG